MWWVSACSVGTTPESNDYVKRLRRGPHQLHRRCFLSSEREVILADFVLNTVDSEHHDGLAMSLSLLVALSPLLLEHDGFLTLGLRLHSRVDFAVLHVWSTNGRVVHSSHEENIADADLLANLKGK